MGKIPECVRRNFGVADGEKVDPWRRGKRTGGGQGNTITNSRRKLEARTRKNALIRTENEGQRPSNTELLCGIAYMGRGSWGPKVLKFVGNGTGKVRGLTVEGEENVGWTKVNED